MLKIEKNKKKYNLPIIGHFRDKSIRFDSIVQAHEATGINYHLIFENAIGKIRSAMGSYWEYENGAHWLKYRAQYIRKKNNYMRIIGFNG